MKKIIGDLNLVHGEGKSSNVSRIENPRIDYSNEKFQSIINCEKCMPSRSSGHGRNSGSGGRGNVTGIKSE